MFTILGLVVFALLIWLVLVLLDKAPVDGQVKYILKLIVIVLAVIHVLHVLFFVPFGTPYYYPW